MTAALKIRSGFKAAGPAKTSAAESGGPELKRLDGWATIHGRFVLDGEAPAPASIRADKDPEFCGQHPLFNESIVANGKVARQRGDLRSHAEDSHPRRLQAIGGGRGHRRQQELSIPAARVKHARRSDARRAEFRSSGPQHEHRGQSPAGEPADSGRQRKRNSRSSRRSRAIGLSCNIHPWMKGRVVVTTNPYCAVSKDDGTFELKNLPAGELELQIWQEVANAISMSRIQSCKRPARVGIRSACSRRTTSI